MTALHQPNPGTIAEYLAGEEAGAVKHEVLSDSTRRTDLGEKRDAYLNIPSLKALLLIEPETPLVTVHRRQPEGGFASECHRGLDAVVPLPLAALYERSDLSA